MRPFWRFWEIMNPVIPRVLGGGVARTSDALSAPPARALFPPKTRLRKTCNFAATFAFLGRKGPFCATKMFYMYFVQLFGKNGPKNMLFCNEKRPFCSQFRGFGKLLYFLHFTKNHHFSEPLRRNGFQEMLELAPKFDIP